MNRASRRNTSARRKVQFSASFVGLESRNLLSTVGAISAPTLTAFEKTVVRRLDAYVLTHPGSLVKVQQARTDLTAALNNPATPRGLRKLDQMALDVVDQVLIDNGLGGAPSGGPISGGPPPA